MILSDDKLKALITDLRDINYVAGHEYCMLPTDDDYLKVLKKYLTTDGRYGITALELHERVIADVKAFLRHMDVNMPYDTLDTHDRRTLEQTIQSVLAYIILHGVELPLPREGVFAKQKEL